MTLFLIGAALLGAQVSIPAAASPDVKRRDVPVVFNDLDLSTASGVAALEGRLARAVLKACGTAYYLDPQQVEDMERCRAGARVRAEALRDAIVKRHIAKAGFERGTSL